MHVHVKLDPRALSRRARLVAACWIKNECVLLGQRRKHGNVLALRKPVSSRIKPNRRYIGVSRTTFSTLASSTVSLDKCSSAASCAAVI
jgi:hypothetical protein